MCNFEEWTFSRDTHMAFQNKCLTMHFCSSSFLSVSSSSAAQSCLTLCDPMRLPCPSPTPEPAQTHPSSLWCHPTISSSVVPFSSYPQSFPASVSFPRNKFFTSGDQSIGVSASTSVLPVNMQDWFPLGLTGMIFFSPRDSPESSPIP